MMMKDSPCCAILLLLKLSSPHCTLVFIKQLLCTEAPYFTICRSSLLLFVLDKFFFLFWLVLYCCTLLHSNLSSPCCTPFVTNVFSHKSCLNFSFVWLLEKFSLFGWYFVATYRCAQSFLHSIAQALHSFVSLRIFFHFLNRCYVNKTLKLVLEHSSLGYTL
jgi:hypothetical protein